MGFASLYAILRSVHVRGGNENGPRRARLMSILVRDQSWFIREWVRVSFMNTYTSSEQAIQAVTYQ
ncbi:hypothetical protein M2318_002419 [Metapseudomonas resinovorans]